MLSKERPSAQKTWLQGLLTHCRMKEEGGGGHGDREERDQLTLRGGGGMLSKKRPPSAKNVGHKAS